MNRQSGSTVPCWQQDRHRRLSLRGINPGNLFGHSAVFRLARGWHPNRPTEMKPGERRFLITIWYRAKRAARERLTRRWTFQSVRNGASGPLVSVSFDDFPRSAAKLGAQVLRDFGVKGTYFVSGGRAGLHVDGLDQFVEEDLIEVAANGHEIGCHTFGHVRLPGTSP